MSRSSGLTMVELLVATAIGSLSIIALGGFAVHVHANLFGLHERQGLIEMRDLTAVTLSNPAAVSKTLKDPNNPSFACLGAPTTCPTAPTLVQLLDPQGNPVAFVYDPVAAASGKYLGFDAQGAACTSSSPTGDPNCRFQARVSWSIVCPTCAAPQIKWQVAFTDASQAPGEPPVQRWNFAWRTNSANSQIAGIKAGWGGDVCVWYKNGTAKCWGSNATGNLGYGTIGTNSPTPGFVLDSANNQVTGIQKIVDNTGGSCALMSNQTVQCWGQNISESQLGLGAAFTGVGAVARVSGPVLTGAGTAMGNVSDVYAGYFGACAQVTNGAGPQLWCWGWQGYPVGTHLDVPLLFSNFDTSWLYAEQVQSGSGWWLKTCVTPNMFPTSPTMTLAVDCEYDAWNGLVSPAVSYMPPSFTGEAESDFTMCLIIPPNGEVTCWGADGFQNWGRMGTPAPVAPPPPPPDILPVNYHFVNHNNRIAAVGGGLRPYNDTATTVSAGNLQGAIAMAPKTHDFNCALVQDPVTSIRNVVCWGWNGEGECGSPNLGAYYGPGYVVAPGGGPGLLGVKQLDATLSTVCATTDAGNVYCWGINITGILGSAGPPGQSSAPVQIPLPGPAASVAVGEGYACAALTSGDVYCWGDNSLGELGNGTVGGTNATPQKVIGL